VRIDRFENIEAWQLARELTRMVYDLNRKTKFARDFGLREQFQDAYDHAAHTQAAIRGFICYLTTYKQRQQKQGNP